MERFIVLDRTEKIGEDEYDVFVVWDKKRNESVGEPFTESGEAEDVCGSLNLTARHKRKGWGA